LTKWQPTIGIFVGIFSPIEGSLLLRRREAEDGSFVGDWELPGGVVEAAASRVAIDERFLGKEALRILHEQTGIQWPSIQAMPAMYPAVPEGGTDLALVTILGTADTLETRLPSKGTWKYVIPLSLQELADGPEGDRLVYGRKRMFRMCLRLFASRDCPNRWHRNFAIGMLIGAQEEPTD